MEAARVPSERIKSRAKSCAGLSSTLRYTYLSGDALLACTRYASDRDSSRNRQADERLARTRIAAQHCQHPPIARYGFHSHSTSLAVTSESVEKLRTVLYGFRPSRGWFVPDNGPSDFCNLCRCQGVGRSAPCSPPTMLPLRRIESYLYASYFRQGS